MPQLRDAQFGIELKKRHTREEEEEGVCRYVWENKSFL